MKRGPYLAPFAELADPRRLAELARAAEPVGWDGLFLWDRIAYPPGEPAVADLPGADGLAGLAEEVQRARAGSDGAFDLVVAVPPGADVHPWQAAAATWARTGIDPPPSQPEVGAVVDAGPDPMPRTAGRRRRRAAAAPPGAAPGVRRRAPRPRPGRRLRDGADDPAGRAHGHRGQRAGVDLSAAMLDRARDLARAQGLGNVTFQRADAQVHRFPPARFDLAISRFGTMFFDDPAAAFANLARALRPGGRLLMLVWQGQEHNQWTLAIHRSLEPFEGSVAVAPAGPDPFSLADPARVAGILEGAGLAGVGFSDVHQPVYYGPDVAAALAWVGGFTCTNDVLQRLDPAGTERALQRLRDTLAAHAGDDGVWLDSRAWVVTARRR